MGSNSTKLSREQQLYEFGPFKLDRDERILFRDGKPVPLAPKAFEVLLVLVENCGHVVAKEQLMNRVWADAFVEEGNLKVTVSLLRKALDEGAGERRYIETVPKRGYRFVAGVQRTTGHSSVVVLEQTRSSVTIEEDEIESSDQEDGSPSDTLLMPGLESAAAPQAPATLSKTSDRARLRVALVLSAVAAVAIALGLILASRKPADRFQAMRMVRYAGDGAARLAAISPDGRYLAISSEKSGRESLVLSLVETGTRAEIVPPADAKYMGLAFSEDGNYVIYSVMEKKAAQADLFKVSVLGGPSRKLAQGLDSPPSFSPDRTRFAFVRESSAAGESALMIATADGRDERKLAARKLPDFFDYPAWSPDGKVIACTVVNSTTGSHVDLAQVGVLDGIEKPIASRTWSYIEQLKWLKDGSGLLMSAREQGSRNFQVWEVTYPRGEARKITNDPNSYEGVCLTADSGTLVTVDMSMHSSLWVAPDGNASMATQLAPRVTENCDPAWTPDEKIVYTLDGLKGRNLWLTDPDGSNQRQLTGDPGNVSGPSISPDGQYIVFAADWAGSINIWKASIDGQNPRQLTFGASENRPRCSPDGKWVVFTSFDAAAQSRTLFKVPVEGGAAKPLAAVGSSCADVSPDMKSVACFTTGSQTATGESPMAICVLAFDAELPLKLFKPPGALSYSAGLAWTPDSRGVTYVATRDGVSNIWEQPIDGSPPRPLTDFKSDLISSFAWSRKGTLVCTRGSIANDVILITNIR